MKQQNRPGRAEYSIMTQDQGQGESAAPGAVGSLRVVIPMDPPYECNPNARTRVVGYNIIGKPIKKGIHWREKAAAVKSFREASGWRAVQARMDYLGLTMTDTVILDAPIFTGSVVVRARIGWGKGRKTQDDTNAAASLKAAIDGLQDANILQNDKQVRHLEVTQDRDKDGAGYVVLEVTPLRGED